MNITTNKLLYISTSLLFSLQLLASTESPSLASTKSTISPSSSCDSLYGDGLDGSPLSTARTGSPERRSRNGSHSIELQGTVQIEPKIQSAKGLNFDLISNLSSEDRENLSASESLFDGIRRLKLLTQSERNLLFTHFGTNDSNEEVVPVKLILKRDVDCHLTGEDFHYLPLDHLKMEDIKTAEDGSQYLTIQMQDFYRNIDVVHLKMRLKLVKTMVEHSLGQESERDENTGLTTITHKILKQHYNFSEMLGLMKIMHKLQSKENVPQLTDDVRHIIRIISASPVNKS